MSMFTIIYLVLIFAMFYFMLIRPQKKKSAELQIMRDSLKVGDKVTTIGGFKGKITKVYNDEVIIENGPDNVRLKFTKWAINTVDNEIVAPVETPAIEETTEVKQNETSDEE